MNLDLIFEQRQLALLRVGSWLHLSDDDNPRWERVWRIDRNDRGDVTAFYVGPDPLGVIMAVYYTDGRGRELIPTETVIDPDFYDRLREDPVFGPPLDIKLDGDGAWPDLLTRPLPWSGLDDALGGEIARRRIAHYRATTPAPPEIAGADLPPQLFVGEAPMVHRFLPPTMRNQLRVPAKPWGGLWTSSEIPGWRTRPRSAWIRWCGEVSTMTHRVAGRPAWRLRPDAAARILVIDGVDDLVAVWARWPTNHLAELTGQREGNGVQELDIDAITAAGYDAIHLTARGAATTRHAFRYDQWGWLMLDLNTWEVESTLWLRWVFAGEAEPAGTCAGKMRIDTESLS